MIKSVIHFRKAGKKGKHEKSKNWIKEKTQRKLQYK